MMWLFLLAGVLLMTFTVIMFLRGLDEEEEISFVKFIFLIGLPGAVGGMCILSFWILLIAKVILKMVQ